MSDLVRGWLFLIVTIGSLMGVFWGLSHASSQTVQVLKKMASVEPPHAWIMG